MLHVAAPHPPRRGKRERLATALDAIGLLDRALWLKRKLGLPVLTVLTYHRVAEDHDVGELDTEVIDARPAALEHQLSYLRDNFSPVTTADLCAFARGKPLPRDPVMVAFDDGYMDCHDVALPLLTRFGVPATFFIPTAFPDGGRLFWWDKVALMMRRCKKSKLALDHPVPLVVDPMADPGRATQAVAHVVKNHPGLDLERFLAALGEAAGVHLSAEEEKHIAARTIMGMTQVRALLAAGMDVQSHSHSHRVLDTLSPDEAREDLHMARRILQEALGKPVDAVAYPVGYTLRGKYRRIAEESGYTLGFTNSSGRCRLDAFDPYSISRVAMGVEHTGAAAKLLLLLGAEPHPLHDPAKRLFTGDAPRPLSRRTITRLPDLCDLSPEWSALEARSATRSPTMTPDWMLTWWRMFGDVGGRKLWTIELREGERLVGLAPLSARVHWYKPAVPYRRVELLASGEDEADEILSEYIGVLAEPGYEASVAEQIAAALTSGDAALPSWDELVMPLMNGRGALPRLLADALRDRGVRVALSQQSEAPYIQLPSSWERYLALLSSEKRYFVNRSLRDFDRWAKHGGTIERATCPATLARGFEILASLHGDRWKVTRAGGAFGSPRFRAFHASMTSRLLEQGALDLSWLLVGGEPVAALYSIVWAGAVHFYQSGRKVDLPPGLRPGIVLHAHAIQRAIGRGLVEYDFLGGASQYKTRMATATRPLVQLRATRTATLDTLRGVADTGIASVRSMLRRSPQAAAG